VYLLGFRRGIRPVLLDLEQARASVAPYAPGTSDFADNLLHVDEQIEGNRSLADAWKAFSNTLLDPEEDRDPREYRVAEPPVLHFRRDAILGGRLNLRLYNAMPNLLTGFGILGTFLGLVAGISLASNGLASSDPADAKAALQTLLDGASLAFGTSIAGLLSSIVFSWAEKWQLHEVDKALGQWHSALEQRLRRITPEEFAQHQLAQTLQQTEVLKGFTEPLAFQIADQLGKQFEAQVTTAIAPALNALVEGVNGLREDRQRTDADMLGQVLEQFTRNLRGAAGTEMDSMAATLATLNDKLVVQAEAAEARHLASQQEARQSMEQLGALFSDGTERLQQRVEQSVQRLSAGMEQVIGRLADQQRLSNADASKRLKDIAETFNQAIEGLRSTLDEMRTIGTDNRETADNLKAVIAELGRVTERLKGLDEPIRDAAERFARTGTGLGEQVEAISATAGKFRNTALALQESNEQTRQAWAGYQARFEGIDEALGNAFSRLQEGTRAYATQVNETLKVLDTHAGHIANHLGGAVEQLNESIDELADTLGRGRAS
jgi:hypothetical protein